MADPDGYHKQLLRDAHFLCSHQRMNPELLDKLVLQLNRTYPQILCDKEAHRFRNLRVPTKLRLAELFRSLHYKGEEACYEFYRGLQIHAEDVYYRLPSRVSYREMADPKRKISEAVSPECFVPNDKASQYGPHCSVVSRHSSSHYIQGSGFVGHVRSRVHHRPVQLPLHSFEQSRSIHWAKGKGPLFFLKCFSFVVGIALLYYYGEEDSLGCTAPLLHCSARRLSKGAKQVLITYADMSS